MAQILFNTQGVPLAISTNRFFASTKTDTASTVFTKQKREFAKLTDTSVNQEFVQLTSIKLLSWGTQNDFPQWADKIIGSTSVLNSGLKFIRNIVLGQGLMACRIDGYDEKGNEKYVAYDKPEVQKMLDSRMIREFLERTARDYFKYGSSAVQFVPNTDGSKIDYLNTINAYFWRLSERNEKDLRETLVTSGKFPDTPGKDDYDKYKVLLDYALEKDLDLHKLSDKSKESFVVMVRDSWSNKDVYAEPIWLSAYLAGWVDIAKVVPKFLLKVFENRASWKWHIQFPLSFWESRFPQSNYATTQEREQAINDYIDEWEKNNLGSENADKPIITQYDDQSNIDKNGRSGIIIEPLKNTDSHTDNLITSATANSEIMFALMINPNILGAAMPGGTYAGNQGGSNIREGFLVKIATSWLDRQNLLDPIYLMLRYNGYDDVVIRYRNTILTTLDTGSGTQKNLA